MQLTPVMKKIAGQCAENVVIPYFWDCCGAGGDRSFIYPDLGESGTRDIAMEIENEEFDGYYSLARTCEINLEENTSFPFESIIYLVDEVSEQRSH